MSLIAKIGRWLEDVLDPIPQNKNAVLYGFHNGMTIRLRPVIDANGRVTSWVPDHDVVALVEAGKAQELASAKPPVLPGDQPQTQTQPQPQPPSLPGDAATAPDGFNPAGVAGL